MTRARIVDRVIAGAALVVLAPVLATIALVVRLTSPGPAWHRATRAGIDGVPFTLFKFRSMTPNAAGNGTLVTAAGDRRVTRVGRVLRAWKLDELPQLVNVVRGEMSIVGPRPEDPAYVDLENPMHVELYEFAPGITGPASIAYRNEEKLLAAAVTAGESHDQAYRRIAREKMELDLEYLRARTLRSDIAMVAKTVASVVGRPRRSVGSDHTPTVDRIEQRAELDATYRAYAGDYAETRWGRDIPGNAEIVAERDGAARDMCMRLAASPIRRVLDLGAGSAGSFPDVFDVEQRVRLDVLEWRLAEGDRSGAPGLAVCGDGASLPMPGECMDAVLVSTVLSSIDGEVGAALLAEARRVLRPGGLVVIYDFRVPNPRNQATRAIRRRWLRSAMHGFDIEARSVTVLPPLARRSPRLYEPLAALPALRTHNLVVGRRCAS